MAIILLDIHRFLGVFRGGAEEQQATSDAFLKHPALGGTGTALPIRNTDQFYCTIRSSNQQCELARSFFSSPRQKLASI